MPASRLRLGDERGVALVIAIGMMLVLAIVLGAVLELSAGGSRHASRSNADEKAYRLAEAGVHDAVAVIGQTGANVATLSTPTTSTIEGNTVTWSGTYDGTSKIWTVTSKGSVWNPTGPGAAAVTRTIVARLKVDPPPYNFVSLNADPSCDHHTLVIKSSGVLKVTNEIFVNSCSDDDGLDIFGSGGTITAPGISMYGGWETHAGPYTVTVGDPFASPADPACPLEEDSKFAPSNHADCPLVGQPLLPDPLAGQVVEPTLGAPAWVGGSTTNSYSPNVTLGAAAPATPAPVVYTPSVQVNGPIGTARNGIAYNTNVTLGANAVTAATAVNYNPAVTVKGILGLTANQAAYSPGSSLSANAAPGPVGVPYAPPVTVKGILGTTSNQAAYTPGITVFANTLGAPVPVNYSPPVTVKGILGTTSNQAAYTPGITLFANAAGAPLPVNYSPPVTVKGILGTTSNQAAYTPGITLFANAAGAPLPVNYSPPVTVKGILGTTSNQAAYTPGITVSVDTGNGATIQVSGAAVATGETIRVENEQMLVTAGGGTTTLTVTRGVNNTAVVNHKAGKIVYNVVADTVVRVGNTAPTSSVQNDDIIEIDNEQMLVTGVSNYASGIWDLTVTRAYRGTTRATHNLNAAVQKLTFPDLTIQVTGAAPTNGDTIQIENEQMTVTNVSGSGPWTLTVTRAVNGTTEAIHNAGKVVYKVVPDTLVRVGNTPPTASVQNGDIIEIDNERMLVNGVSNYASGIWDLTVTRAHMGTTKATHNLNAAVQKLTFPDLTIQVTGAAPSNGDTIQIENEQMTVTNVSGSGPWTLTVTRAVNGTTEAIHNAGKVVYKVVPDTLVRVGNTPPTSSVQNGDAILIDNELMLVTGVSNYASGIWDLTVTRAHLGTTKATHALNAAVEKATFPDHTITVTGSAPAVGDTIQVESEQMTVTNVSGSGPWTLTVTRGVNGTTEVAHNAGKIVYKVVPDTLVRVGNTPGFSSVVSGDTIEIDNERMLVTGVASYASGIWDLTVIRAYAATTKATHNLNAAVQYVALPGVLVVKNTGGALGVVVGDTVWIDSENMTVTGITGSGPWRLAVTRAVNGTTQVAHNANKIVYKVVADDIIQVTNTGGSSAVSAGDEIQIDNEQMLVTAVAVNGTDVYNLTVIRPNNGTTKAIHTVTTIVKEIFGSTNIRVTNDGSISAVSVGDVIIVDSEQMLVLGVTTLTMVSPGVWDLTVTRAANGTTEAAHNAGATVYQVTAEGSARSPELYTVSASGAQTLPSGAFPGDTFTYYGGLCIGVPNGMVCNNTNCKTADLYAGVPYSPAQTGTITAGGTTLTITIGGGTAIANGDYIKIENEKLLVVSGGGTATITVARAQLGTAAVAHSGKPVLYIVGTPNVTLTDGTYIMAGGGFRVCGAATVNAPNVLIYNTTDGAYADLDQIQINTKGTLTLGAQDSGPYSGLTIYQKLGTRMSGFDDNPYPGLTLAAAIPNLTDASFTASAPVTGIIAVGHVIQIDDEVMLVTGVSGVNVTVQLSGGFRAIQGSYPATHAAGAAIKQVTGEQCDGRSAAKTDVLFSASAGGLDAISGTIYEPDQWSLFSNSMSGTANLAVITGCLFIDGGNSTFNFIPNGLFGSGGAVTFLDQTG